MEPLSPIKLNTQPLSDVYQLHLELSQTISEMDVKIEEVILKHQAQFLLAYRNHIKNMKEELTGMRERAEEQEKKMQSNDRAVYLEKQLILFREEALKLYDKLEEKTHECQITKTMLKQMEKGKIIIEKQNKQLMRNAKVLETQLKLVEGRLKQNEREYSQLKDQIQNSQQKHKHLLTKGQTLNSNQQTDNIYTPKPKESHVSNPYPQALSINSKYPRPKQLQVSKDTINTKYYNKPTRKISEETMDHQLKNWFLQCLQTIRREVAQRKVYGYKSEEINKIGSWEQFRMIDKLRLLEMFMQNQKLLVWMYQRIFPSRISQIQGYLTKKKTSVFQSREKSKSLNIQMQDLGLSDNIFLQEQESVGREQQVLLPKVISLGDRRAKTKKYDIRNRIEMKNGKLNLSQMPSQLN